MTSLLDSLGTIIWDWDPALIRIGSFELRYYGVLFALALAGGYMILRWRYKDEGEDPETATNLTYALMIAIVVGARLFHVFFYDFDKYMAEPLEIVKFWKGGLASHGAATGMILTCLGYDYFIRKTPIRITADRLAFAIPLAMICVRLGNFFNSEIVGAPCDPNSPIAFIFTRYDGVPRYPSQLFEVGMGLISALIIYGTYFFYKKRGKDMPLGMSLSLILISYFGMRFCVEFFKEYQIVEEGVLRSSGLREGQLLSIPFLLIGFTLLGMCIFGPWKTQHARDYTKKYQLKYQKEKTDDKAEETPAEKTDNSADSFIDDERVEKDSDGKNTQEDSDGKNTQEDSDGKNTQEDSDSEKKDA